MAGGDPDMEPRTSETHPLRIDRVELRNGGAIGLTICPGKKQIDGMSGIWMRDLEIDLDSIAADGYRAIYSLMEDAEYLELQVPLKKLRSGARARGIELHHLPIEDVSVPDRGFEMRWLHAGARARYLLERGERVLVHCKGGLGRSGLVAARIMVELGYSAGEAIDAVRAARKGAIETLAQEQDVSHREQRLKASIDLARRDRIVGALLGGAVGDALGAAVEFDSMATIRERFGAAGIQSYAPCFGGTGRITDDTQMTLFTSEGLLEALAVDGEADSAAALAAIDRAYRRWRMTQEAGPSAAKRHSGLLGLPELWSCRAPGNTCMSALEQGQRGSPEHPLNDSKGCGGVMRVAPLGLAGARFGSRAVTYDLGLRSAAITHGHPSGQHPAALLAVLLQELVDGKGLDEALDRARDCMPESERTEETRACLRAALAIDAPDALVPEVIEELGSGFVGEEALAIGLACARAATDFDAAVRAAVNHGGDSDSTGLIAGQIVGALEGAGAIPPVWLEDLELVEVLLEQGLELEQASRWHPARRRVERLLEFSELFEVRTPDEQEATFVDPISLEDRFGEVEQLLYRDGWMAGPEREAHAAGCGDEDIAVADFETCRGLLAIWFRGFRDDPEAFEETLASGAPAHCLKRLRTLIGDGGVDRSAIGATGARS